MDDKQIENVAKSIYEVWGGSVSVGGGRRSSGSGSGNRLMTHGSG